MLVYSSYLWLLLVSLSPLIFLFFRKRKRISVAYFAFKNRKFSFNLLVLLQMIVLFLLILAALHPLGTSDRTKIVVIDDSPSVIKRKQDYKELIAKLRPDFVVKWSDYVDRGNKRGECYFITDGQPDGILKWRKLKKYGSVSVLQLPRRFNLHLEVLPPMIIGSVKYPGVIRVYSFGRDYTGELIMHFRMGSNVDRVGRVSFTAPRYSNGEMDRCFVYHYFADKATFEIRCKDAIEDDNCVFTTVRRFKRFKVIAPHEWYLSYLFERGEIERVERNDSLLLDDLNNVEEDVLGFKGDEAKVLIFEKRIAEVEFKNVAVRTSLFITPFGEVEFSRSLSVVTLGIVPEVVKKFGKKIFMADVEVLPLLKVGQKGEEKVISYLITPKGSGGDGENEGMRFAVIMPSQLPSEIVKLIMVVLRAKVFEREYVRSIDFSEADTWNVVSLGGSLDNVSNVSWDKFVLILALLIYVLESLMFIKRWV